MSAGVRSRVGSGRSATAGLLVAVALAAAGCAGEPASLPPPPAADAEPSDAADGKNVGACLDGTCEVRVTGPVTLPVAAEFDVSGLRVAALEGDQVLLAGEFPGGSVGADSCAVATRTSGGRASLQARCRQGGRLTLEKLTIAVVSVQRGAAVLRIAPR